MERLFIIFILLGGAGIAVLAEVSEESNKYHRLLLKKPGSELVFERFLQAWLTTGDRESLEVWLQGEAKEGTVADWQILATYYEDTGESGEALAALDRALTLDGENLSLKLARAKLRAKGMDFEGALEDLKPVVEDAKLRQEAMTLQGVYQVRVGRPNDAVRIWEELAKLFPGDEALREDLIEIEIREGLFERAIESSLALVGQTKDPYQKALRQIRLAEVYGLADRKDESLATYEKVMAASGEGTWLEREVLSQVEQIYVWRDDVQGLRDYYQKLRENYPRRTSIRKALAKQMARNDELEEAIALFREVLKITPGDLGNREEFVAFLEVNELWKEASIELEELIKQKGDDPLLWERVVVLKHQLKDEVGLRKGLEKLEELKGGDPEGVVVVASLYKQLELAKDGEVVLREGRKKFPESTAVAEALAEVLVKTERRDEARKLWLSVAASGERDDVLRVVRSLARNEMKGEAFELLLKHVRKSPEDHLLVTQLGQLALTPEQAVEATSFILKMVERATTPTALENSVALAAGVVLRSKREREVAEKLKKDPGLSIAERCFLAELHSTMGDRVKARDILEQGGDDRLLVFFRVRFEEKEGALGSAISLLEKILAEPGARKTVHLRRLVDLYQKAGRLSEALERADEWKKMSPGNQQAWLTKARLLSAGGQREKAVTEYRRILGKFGADEESRARLATALEEQGDYQGAGKVYRKLYETAGEQRDQLKWVAKWASVVQQIGGSGEVLEVLEARKKSNRKSAGPLLALAEVHEVLGDSNKRREALLEAVRRKPEGWEILLDLAKESEKEGDFETAVKTLQEAIVLEKGEESKRALAELLLRNGDVEGGLALIKSIPGEGDDPRQVEKTVETFVRSGSWEIAEKYLADILPRHGGDWRLEYLQGLLFIRKSETEKALEIMKSLGRVVQPLVGVNATKPSQPGAKIWRSYQPSRLAGSPAVIELQQIYQRCLMPVGQEQRDPFAFAVGSGYGSRRSLSGNSQMPLFALPQSPEELRKFALVRKAILLVGSEDEASQKEFDGMIEDAGFDEKIFLLRTLKGDRYRDFLLTQIEKSPDDPQIAWLWLQATPTNDDDEYREMTKRAFALLRKEAPLELLRVFPYYFAKIDSYENGGFANWKELYLGLSDEEKKKILPTLIHAYGHQNDPFSSSGIVPKTNFQEEWEFFEAEVLGLELPIQYGGFYQAMIAKFLRAGKGEEAAKLIDRCVKWTLAGGFAGAQSNPYQRRSRSEFRAIAMPRFAVGDFVDLSSLIHPGGMRERLGDDEKMRQLALLEKLGAVDDGKMGVLFPGDVLAPHVHHIEDPLHKGLILMLLDKREELEKLVPMMAASKDPGQLQFVAAYHSKYRKFREAYENLLQLSELPLDRIERQELDGHLAYTVNQLSEVELKEVDLKPAREALMRVQRRTQQGNLQAVMRKLGMNDEADRLDRIALSKQQLRQNRSRATRRNPLLQGKEFIARELTMNAPERAIAEMKRLVQGYRGRANPYGNWSEILLLFEKASQVSSLLEELKPKGRGKAQDWYLYGGIASQTQMKDVAKEAFGKILEMQPDHHQARLELFLLGSEEERDWSIFSPKKNPDSAGILGATLYGKFSNQRPISYDLMMDTCRAAQVFLGGDSELDPRKGINGWLSGFCSRSEGSYQFEDFEISPLIGTGRVNETKWDQGKNDRRVSEFRKLYEKMMKHGFLADNGFRGLRTAREIMGLTDEELFQFANLAHAKVLEKPDQEGVEFYSDPFANSRGNLLASSAMAHLLESCGERKGEIFTAVTLKVMAEHRPDSYRNYQFALQILKAPPGETGKLYGEWIAGFPENERTKRTLLTQGNRLLTAFGVEDGEWANLHEKELFGLLSTQSSDVYFLTYWGKWVFMKRGAQGLYQWVSELCENSLGDRERWALLAELSPGFRPASDQSKISLGEQQLKALVADPVLAAPVAAAIKREKLDGLLPGVGNAFREGWANRIPSSSEDYFDWLKSFGGLGASSDSAKPDVFHLLVFLDAFSKTRVPREQEMADLKEMLSEDEELDPLMRELLKIHWGIAVEWSEFFDENLDVFVKMAEVAPLETAVLLGRWLPALEEASLSETSATFVAKVTGGIRGQAFDLVVGAAKQAGGAEAYLKNAKSYQDLADLIPLSPVETARAFGNLVEQALVEREEGGAHFRDSISRDQYLQQRLSSISQVLNDPVNRGASVSEWKFLNALCHGFYRDHVEAILVNQGQFMRLLGEMVKIERGRVRAEGEVSRATVKVLRSVLAKMTVDERRSMLLFLPLSGDSDWGSYRDQTFQEDFKWVDQEFRKDFPACADYGTAVMSRGIYGSHREKFSKEINRGSANLLRFLKESQFPSSLEIMAVRMLITDSSLKLHLRSPGHWEWMGEAIKRARFTGTGVKNTGSLRFLTSLDPKDFEEIDKIPPVLISAMMEFTKGGWKESMDQRSYEKIFKSVMILAAKAGDRDSVKRLMKISPKFLNAHLALQRSLFEAGCGDLLLGKLDVKMTGMTRDELPLVGKGSSEEIQKFVAIFPKDYRFHLERQFLTARDQGGENAPELSYQERIPVLAQRYLTEGGGPREFVLSDLAFFARDERTYPILADHFLAEEKNHLLGSPDKNSRNSVQEGQLRQIIWAAVTIEVGKGNFEPAWRQFQSIFGQRGGDRYNLQSVDHMFPTVAYEVLRLSIESPERAGEFVALTDELFKGVLRLPNSSTSPLTLKADAFSSLQRLLADQPVEEKEGFRLWKEYQEFKRNYPLTAWSQLATGSKWSSQDGIEMLNHLQGKIFTSKAYLREVNCHPGLGGLRFQDDALVRGVGLKRLMEELPKEILKEPFFMWKSGLFTSVPDDALEGLSKARAAAKDAGFAEMEAEIMIDTVMRLQQLKRIADARALANEIDPEVARKGPRWKKVKHLLGAE